MFDLKQQIAQTIHDEKMGDINSEEDTIESEIQEESIDENIGTKRLRVDTQESTECLSNESIEYDNNETECKRSEDDSEATL